MNSYVVAGFIVALGGTALYSLWTIVIERRIAAEVLAIESALERNPSGGSSGGSSGGLTTEATS